jgi:uncharacterized damage-inducible protein DinB
MIRSAMGFLGIACLLCAPAFCANPPTIGEILDSQFQLWEQEITSAVEAMPADKFDFAPTAGEFKGARTFGQQAKHLAAVIYGFSAGVLAEKPPADTGKLNEGPEALRTKAEIVLYVRGAFAYGHKAMLSLNEKNQLRNLERGSQATPLYEATFLMSHSMDHYGQMVEYLRMNGIVPPARGDNRREASARVDLRFG